MDIKIETERLILRPISMFDAKDMFEYASDPEVSKFLTWEPHKNLEETLNVLSKMTNTSENHKIFAIVLKEKKKMIGTMDAILFGRCEEDKKAEIGYCISREYWNKGITTEALKAMIDFLFKEYNLHRIQAKHAVDNPASGRVMEKAGMQKEGILRDYMIVRGKYLDLVIKSILSKER